MVTRRLLPCYAAGGVPVSAALLRTSPSACGTNQANGTRCCLSARSISACLASAMCCCVPFAADRAAPATHVPPRASLLGAPAVWESMDPLFFRHRAPAPVLENACRRRSSLPVPVACRTGETRPRAILRGASPCPASATVPPSPYRAVSALVRIDCLRLLPLAPAVWSSPRAAPPHGCRLDCAIPAAGSSTLRPPPGLSPYALPPAGFPPRPFPLIASHLPLPPPPPRPAFLVPLRLLPRPAPASVPWPPSRAGPLRERRHCCSIPIRGVVPRILANDLSHRGAVRDLPASRTPLRRGGFRPPRQSCVRPLGATRFDPFLRHPLSHFLFDRPSWPGPDPRGRLSAWRSLPGPPTFPRRFTSHPLFLTSAKHPTPAQLVLVHMARATRLPSHFSRCYEGAQGAGGASASGTSARRQKTLSPERLREWAVQWRSPGVGSGHARAWSPRGTGPGGASAGVPGVGRAGGTSAAGGTKGTSAVGAVVGGTGSRRQKPLSPERVREWAVWWGSPNGGAGRPGSPLAFKAPREWHDTLRTILLALGFAPSTADPSLFLRTNTSLPVFYVIVYVDDLVFATADTEAVALVLQRFGFQFFSPQPTPLPTGHSLSAPPSDESVEPSGPYLEFVGCLMHVTTCTRPDLAYPLSLLARYVALGRHRKTTHRSTHGYSFSLSTGSISWRSTRSSSVLSSSSEAEIYAGAMATQELCWLTYLLTDLGERPRSPPVLYVNNKAMIALCQDQRLEHRMKHIDLRYFLT
ncbi:unnamed protein product [Closterium sp. NIES-54]